VIDTHCIDETYVWEKYASKAFDMYFGGCSICVLDIETTGLSPSGSYFVLGGLLAIGEGGEARLKQYFAEDIQEETALLKKYIEEASEFDVILTYNGKYFDVPFLLSRAGKKELDIFDMPHNLDLYMVLNGYSTLRKFLPNLKQKTVEDFMGLWPYRSDKISGADSANLYREYLYRKETYQDTKDCIELMLLHNRDDVLQLGKLLPVLEKVDFHKAMYALGFPVISGNKKLSVKSIKLDKNYLKITGFQKSAPIDFISYGSESGDCYIRFEKKQSDFELLIPVFSKAGAAVIDLLTLPVDINDELSSFPNFESGYLIIKNKDDIMHLEVNCFIKNYLLKTLKTLPEDII